MSFYFIRGALPLGLPDTLSGAPLRRRAPFAWLARAARSLPDNERNKLLLTRSALPLGLRDTPSGAPLH